MANEKTKIIKKKWVSILAPALFKEMVLGETSVIETERVIGKTIKASLMDLIGDIKKQNIEVSFKVTALKDNKGVTEITGIKASPSSIRRLVRRGKEKIDTAITCVTADGIKIAIKPFIITKNQVNRSVMGSMYNSLVTLLAKEIRKVKFQTLIEDIISNKITNNLKSALSKIYPVKIVMIREMKAIGVGEIPEQLPEEPKEEAEKAPKKKKKEESQEESAEEEKPKPKKESKKAKQEKKDEVSEDTEDSDLLNESEDEEMSEESEEEIKGDE